VPSADRRVGIGEPVIGTRGPWHAKAADRRCVDDHHLAAVLLVQTPHHQAPRYRCGSASAFAQGSLVTCPPPGPKRQNAAGTEPGGSAGPR
jgi:hypothetical protein